MARIQSTNFTTTGQYPVSPANDLRIDKVEVEESSGNSSQYLRFSEFPDFFVQGGNRIVLNPNGNSLDPRSQVKYQAVNSSGVYLRSFLHQREEDGDYTVEFFIEQGDLSDFVEITFLAFLKDTIPAATFDPSNKQFAGMYRYTIVLSIGPDNVNLLGSPSGSLISQSVFIGNSATAAGIELRGASSFVRSVGYDGFDSGKGGFIMYSGSSDELSTFFGNSYAGVGFEIRDDADNGHIVFSSNPSLLDIKAQKFFIGTTGTNGQFISASNGKIEISSSNFHLDNTGNVIMQGTITADAGNIGGFTITDDSIASTNLNLILSGSGLITASAGLMGGFELASTEIKSSNNNLRLKSSGQISGSNVLFTGGTIGGFDITSNKINSSTDLILSSSGQITGSKVLFTGGKIAGFGISGNTLTAQDFTLDAEEKRLTLGAGTNIFIADGDEGIQLGHGTFDSAPFSVTKAGVLKAESGTVAGWTIDTEKFQGGNMIIRQDGTIESDGFASNVAGSGFRLTAAEGGFLEVENAKIRGTLSTAVFEKESVNAVGGQLYVANSTALTSSALHPQGSYSGSETTMSVVNVTGFEAGEILSLKKVSTSGFSTEYVLVVSSSRNAGSSDTDFSGNLFVSRSIGFDGSAQAGNSSSLGETPSAGQSYSGSQVIVSTGKSGSGFIRLNANPNDQTTPYIDIVERTGSSIYDVELKTRIGDLSGVTDTVNGVAVSGFGLYTDNAFLKGGIAATFGAIGGFGISETTISSSNNNLILKSNGQITGSDVLFNGGRIGGFNMDGHSLRSTGVEINNSTQTLFISSSNFKVNHSGNITGSQVLLDGGTIGGFELSDTEIKSSNNNLRLKSNGQITASSGIVAGWTINSDNLTSTAGNTVIKSNGHITASVALLSGSVVATSFANKVVEVDSGNLSLFTRSNGGGVNLVFDGSQGGAACRHMILTVDPGGTIKGFDLEDDGSDVESEVTIDVTVAAGVFVDDGINSSFNQANQQR